MAEEHDLVRLERLAALIRTEGASVESVRHLKDLVYELRTRMTTMADAHDRERAEQAKRDRGQDEAISALRERVSVLTWAMGIIGVVAAGTALAFIRTGVSVAADRMIRPAAMVSPAGTEDSQ